MKSQTRLIEPELLDHAPEQEAARSLADLRLINRLLGGHAILRWLLAQRFRRDQAFSLLDIGAASGDMGRVVAKAFPKAHVTSLDYRIEHLRQGGGVRVQADAFRLPFADRSFDVVFCSLFLHHFDNDQIVALLTEFRRTCREGVALIDLERSAFAWSFIPATKWLFRWHPLTVHDAPVSVQAGFRAHELRELSERAGLHRPQVRGHWPWARLSLWAPRGDML